MKVAVLAVGKIREPGLRSVMDDYIARIRRYVPCDEVEVKDDAALEKQVSTEALVVACEVDGEALSSETFSRRVELWGRRGKGIVQFIVGGAEGIPKHVSAAAHARVSLSAMTLPHRLARVVLAEQIYRAFTILRGQPYSTK